MKRYFIVFWKSRYNDYPKTGSWSSVQATYPNLKDTTQSIGDYINVPVAFVAITNIIELTEADYKDWVK